MALLQSGVTTDAAEVDPSSSGVRVAIKPDETSGAFQLSATSGLIAASAINSTVFSFRWAPGTGQYCLVKRVSLGVMTTTGPTVAQQLSWGLFVARNWLTSDTGGTTLQPASLAQTVTGKYRTALQSSVLTDARIATTGALSAGSRILDSQPLNSQNAWIGATASGVGTTLVNTNMKSYSINDHPLVLQNNEGFVINLTLASVVMVHQIIVNVEWAEVNVY